MTNIVKSLNLKDGNVLEIYHDEDVSNPRPDDEGRVGFLAAFHSRYDLKDPDIPFQTADFNSFDEMKQHIMKSLRATVCLPLFLYDHSGITISTTPFQCAWDSGQIGFIYTTSERLNNVGIKIKDGESWEDYSSRLKEMLVNEVAEFDQYITGDVYRFEVKDDEGNHVDSCSGFYGTDFKNNGLMDYVDSEPINLDDL